MGQQGAKTLFRITLVAVLTCWCGFTAAQSYLVHNYTVDDGLPNSTVHRLGQDPDGSIWFATAAGVVNYDGLEWTLVSSFPETKLRSADYMAIDDNGTIWAGSAGDDLIASFDGETWTEIVLPKTKPRIRILSIAVFLENGLPLLAVGTAESGLYILSGEDWIHLDRDTGLPGNAVRQVYAHDDSFVAATDGGIAVWRKGVLDTDQNALIPEKARDLLALDVTCEDVECDWWLLSTDAVARIHAGKYELLHSGSRFTSMYDRFVILKDHGNFLYFGISETLLQMDMRTGQTLKLNQKTGLINAGATDLLLDRENNLWISGYRGVSKIASIFFSNYRKFNGLLSDEVTALTEPEPGKFVLGHPSGLSILEGDSISRIPFTRPEGLSWRPLRVLDLHTATDGKVWIAAGYRGLGILEADKVRWFGPEDGVTGFVCSVEEDSSGAIYALQSKEILRLEGEQFTPLPSTAVSNATARRLFPGRDGRLYIATDQGFYILKGANTSRIPGLDDHLSANVFSALDDSKGRLWVGTLAGLFFLEDGHLVRPAPPLPRIDRPVFFIAEDHDGEIWFGTENGVLRWNGSTLVPYTTSNGLAGRETNRDAGFVDHLGRIWIGTESGVSVADKGREDPQIPIPRIDTLRTIGAGKEYRFSESIDLDQPKSDITFHFRSISLHNERLVTYSHWLEGLESVWSEPAPAHARRVHYHYLPPGRYRFHVKTRNALGPWSEPVISGWVVVLPPLWQRWWFLLATLGGGGLITALLVVSMIRARYTNRLKLEVKARTAELKESEELYHKLFDEDFPRLLLDPSTMTIKDVNLAGCRLAGLPRRQLMEGEAGKTGVDWIDRLPDQIQDHLGPDPWSLHPFVPEGDCRLDLEIRTQRVSIQGEDRILVTAQDITARRRLEEEQLRASKLESVGLLAGGIAHDFNNLLTAILGNLSLGRMELARGNDPAPSMKAAEEASVRARKLTAQLLTFSRGGQPIRKVLDLAPLLRSSTELALTGSNTLPLFDLQNDLWPVEGDEGQLDQVLNNLVLNALQAMQQGGTVTVTARNLAIEEDSDLPLQAGPWVEITITDEGVGLPPDSIHQIFDPYFTTKGTGSGLGLATCYSIVRNHEGLIRAANMADGGAQFTIYLPATRGTPPTGSTPEPSTVDDRQVRSCKILIMDDEPALQVFYDQALQRLGYTSQVAGDGEAAVELFRRATEAKEPFDLVILDLTVPGGMGGKEALIHLRKLAPDLPAIVVSGYSNDPDMADYRNAGFQGALMKPFTVSDLGAVLDTVLDAAART